MEKVFENCNKENKKTADRELKEMLHKMIDAISDKVILAKAYTFINI